MAYTGAPEDKTMILRSDNDVQKGVEGELSCCPNVDETDIAVKVAGGVVSLTGYVPDLFQKYGAEDAVKRVAGVVAVANDIQVRGTGSESISDPEVARAAVAAIKRQVPLCWEQIRPVVHQGCVTLEGAVAWIYQREEAEEAVRKVKGVVCVINSIALRTVGTAGPGRAARA
jgi:osmotically-inducible protein OsmY